MITKFMIYVANNFIPETLKLKLVKFYKRMPFSRPQVIFNPTILCNYSCSYCLYEKYFKNKSNVEDKRTVEQWLDYFDKLPPSIVTISGGEPLLYDNLEEILRGISKRHLISQMVTNVSVNLDRLIRMKDLGFRIMTSFHREMTDFDSFLERVLYLRKNGFKVVVNYVATSDNLAEYEKYKKMFEENGVIFRLDACEDIVLPELANEYRKFKVHGENYISNRHKTDNYHAKSCLGGSKYLIIMPNANVYRCYHGFWYREAKAYENLCDQRDFNNFFIGNLSESEFVLDKSRYLCHSPCRSSCDIELGDVELV